MSQVIIDDVIPRTQLLASASQTVFNTNWTADAATDILVYARADGVEPNDVTQLVSSSLYNVTFVGVNEFVRVTFLSGRTLNDIITIVRNTPAERMNLYVNTNFVPSMLNQDFGILTLVDQQAQMYDYVVNPGYNVSAIIEDVVDTVLPILGANQIWAMNPTRTGIIPYDVPSGGGVAPNDAKYILQQADSELPNAQSIGALASGIIVGTTSTGVLLSRILTGTTDQISISNGSGISGNPTFSISPNPVLSGTAGMGIPQGTTAQRVTPISGINFRYNTDLEDLEYWDGVQWVQVADQVGEPLTSTDDTNVTLVLGGSPLTALVNAASLTLGWTGQLSPARGGTGVNNASSTLTLAGNLQTSGAFNSVFTMTGATNVTFPTSGTLATVGGTVSSIIGTANQVLANGTSGSAQTGAVTLTLPQDIATSSSPQFAAVQTPAILGANGLNAAVFASPALAVNWITFASSSTGGGPTIAPQGSDTNIPIAYITAGTGQHVISSRNLTTPIVINSGTSLQHTTNLIFSNTAASRDVTFQDASGTVAYLSDVAGAVTSITGTANQVIASAPTGAVTLSLPQSIATTSAVQFNSVRFNTADALLDSNGNVMVSFQAVGSAVNHLEFANNSGASVFLYAVGTAADISTSISAKGTGTVTLNGAVGSISPVVITNGTASQHATTLSFANTAASRTVTFPDATGTLLMTGQAISTVPSIAFSSTSGVIGTTTNDNAAALSVGELVSSVVGVGSPVALTTNTDANVTSISLTAGDWDVWGNVGFFGNSSTLVTILTGWISSTSATRPDGSLYANMLFASTGLLISSLSPCGFCVPSQRFSLSGTTTIYLSARATFTVSTMGAYGGIYARRRR